jgi:hypothetical protein
MGAGTTIEIKSFKVGNDEYKLTPLPPIEAIDFCTDTILALSPVLSNIDIGDDAPSSFAMQLIPNLGKVDNAKLKAMFATVRGSMILPDGNMATDQLSFQKWFDAHKKQLIEAHVKGLFYMVRDFFPQGLGTLLGATNLLQV